MSSHDYFVILLRESIFYENAEVERHVQLFNQFLEEREDVDKLQLNPAIPDPRVTEIRQ